MFCHKCGELLNERTRRCPVCGAVQGEKDILNAPCDCEKNKPFWKERPKSHSTVEGTPKAEKPPREQKYPGEKKGIFQLLIEYATHYFNFSGRCSRRDYWLTYLLVTLLVVVFVMFSDMAWAIVWLLTAIPTLSMTARRLRDAGFSPLWLLAMLIPYVGGILMLVLLCLPSKEKL